MNIVEKMARAIAEANGESFAELPALHNALARAALTATGLTEAQLEGLANGTMVVVRKDTLEGLMPSDLMAGPSVSAILAAKEGT